MKKLIACVLFLSSAATFEETCTFVMRNNRQRDIQFFTRSSYSYGAACSESQYDCKIDLVEKEVRYGWRGLFCSELRSSGYPGPSYPYPGPNYPGPSYPYPGPNYPGPRHPYPGPHYPGPSYPRRGDDRDGHDRDGDDRDGHDRDGHDRDGGGRESGGRESGGRR